MSRMGDLAATDVYNAFDVPLDQGTNVGWANRMGEILTSRPPDNPAVAYRTPYFDITEGDIGRATEAALGGMTVTPKGIRAYHSSPHDFDKFDLAKIGTGEGAQVYGHGLYFAESPAVSGQGGQYYKAFEDRFLRENKNPIEGRAFDYFKNIGNYDRPEAIKFLDETLAERLKRNLHEKDPVGHQNLVAARELLASGGKVGPRTYEVNINADPAHMLDWDKALYQQPAVYEKIKGHAAQVKEMGLQDAYKHFLDAAELKGMPGSDFYQIARKHGPEALSQDLREAGIPGIKYLDQGSRIPDATLQNLVDNAKATLFIAERTKDPALIAQHQANVARLEAKRDAAKSSNYVVFDPGIIDIMKKYGIAGAAPVGMGALAAQDRYQQ